MFKIYDGRSQFYQWDLDRKLIVEDESINQVHFCNRTDDCSLVCEVYNEGELRVVDVPNILLQTDWRINVYGYDAVYTKHSERFDVIARTKPADYVYTETETLNFNTLLERMNDIEGAIGDTVKDYLEENPPEVNLDGYATEEYVQEAIAGIPETDLSDYATIKDVQDAVDGIEIPKTDLSDYYKKAETDAAIKKAVDAIDVPEVDVDLTNYYTKAQTDTAIKNAVDNIEHPQPDLSDYAKKSEIPSTAGLATEKYVDDAIANIDIPTPEGSVEEVYVGYTEPTDPNVKLWVDPGASMPEIDVPEVDLSNYYTKAEVENVINTALGVIENGTY